MGLPKCFSRLISQMKKTLFENEKLIVNAFPDVFFSSLCFRTTELLTVLVLV